ncbi:MAG: quinol monooxygenase YgiN [Cryomorphaceae bacterium]|jgi:quinol monooxygenase YgiN
MAIGITATLTIRQGKNQQFEDIFKRLAEAVNNNEADCNFYQLHKLRSDTVTYVVLEQYANQEALDVHGKTDYFKSIGAELGSCMAKAPEIVAMDSV